MIDRIICGNSLEELKKMPDNSVDCVITSPPYFNLRDYEAFGQIGLEADFNDYLTKLLDIFNEAKRILKSSGSLWINIDDVYCKTSQKVKKGSLMCIPDRLKIKMVDSGWILKNEIIWRKPNAMPSSAKKRFTNDFEKFYFFVKSESYKFHTQYESILSEQKNDFFQNDNQIDLFDEIDEACAYDMSMPDIYSNTKYQDVAQESSVRKGMNKTRGQKVIALRKDLPSQDRFVDFMRSRANIDYICENSNIKRSKIEHWFRKDRNGFAYPSVDDWNLIKWLVDDFSLEFMEIDRQLNTITLESDDILKNSYKGRIKRAVWDICTKAFKGGHFAPYPEKLVEIPIKACTDEGDTVLDMFNGSGTTCLMAKKLNRHFIGIDINENYCKIANQRLKETKK